MIRLAAAATAAFLWVGPHPAHAEPSLPARADVRFGLEEVSQGLLEALGARDAYTRQHSERVRDLARRLGRALKLEPHRALHLQHGAVLLDVGKIGIPDSILLKPGKLTEEEYETIQTHPVIGHRILTAARFPGPVAEIVLSHHERYDGTGYPHGLSESRIPLGARIVAVADAWDAMTSNRPYRKALSRKKALEELRKGAGTQFDPDVVKAFLSLQEETTP